jgi:phytoene dehydrogenase-like protein
VPTAGRSHDAVVWSVDRLGLMSMTERKRDVVVVGAGLAGLRAAGVLSNAGLDVLVLESGPEIGGRVRTDVLDGFVLDHGFQVFNTGYPAARRAWDFAQLQLRDFPRGVQIQLAPGDRVPLSVPSAQLRSSLATVAAAVAGKVGAPWRLAAFLGYAVACASLPADRLRARKDEPLGTALRAWGVSAGVCEQLVAPFLRGVFAEADPLAVGRRYADFVLRSFVRGAASVPAGGMRRLPETLAAALPDNSVKCGVTVTRAEAGRVTTDDGDIRAGAVVVATDGPASAELLPGLERPAMNALTTWYFTSDDLPASALLTVSADPGDRVTNAIVLTDSVPEYSAAGEPLIAATAVGHWPDRQAADRAARECANMLAMPGAPLTEIRRFPIRNALPQARPPMRLRRPVRLTTGLFVIGDHRDTPSIQGALVSGERGARAVLTELRGG